MRILICAVEAPLPPVNGLRLQVSKLVEHLHRDHEVHVVALRAPDQSAPQSEATITIAEGPRASGRVRSLLRRRPPRVDDLAAAIAPAVANAVTDFRPDVLHVTSGRLAALRGHGEPLPAVLAALDAWHLNVAADRRVARSPGRRLQLLIQERLVRAFEAGEYPQYERVVVVSEEDAAALNEVSPSLQPVVIPNGVDVEHYSTRVGRDLDGDRILFTGVMSYAPNVAAAELLADEILPRVRQEWSSARVALVGRAPAERVRSLARPGLVEVTGEVEDMRAWLQTSRAYCCPMVSGTGIKNKLLEAMAAGIPVVATPLATQGLSVRHERELLIGETPDELASALVRLGRDEQLREGLAASARDYVEADHSWASVARAYARVYAEARATVRRPAE